MDCLLSRPVRALMRLTILAGLGAVCLGVMTPAQAVPINFASYQQTDQNQMLVWTDNGASATLGTNPSSPGLDVNFRYDINFPGLPAPLMGNQAAYMTITVPTATTAAASTFMGFLIQPISPAVTIAFTRVTDYGGLDNLLTITFTGRITGQVNSVTGGITGDETIGDQVTFTSDFIDTTGWSQKSLSLTLNTVTPAFQLTGNLLDTFRAFTTGSFAAVVPEPSSVALIGIGLAAAPLALRRRRAKA